MTDKEIDFMAYRLAWKCSHGLKPCKPAAYSCPLIGELTETIYCKRATPKKWKKVLIEYNQYNQKEA